MKFHPQQQNFRLMAKALLAAFLFLSVASSWALPCLTADAGLFGTANGPQSCQEHKLFKPQADFSKLEALPAESAARFPAALAALFVVSIVACIRRDGAPPRLRDRIRVRAGTLPFATSDPPRLPAFAALRDA